MYRRSALKLMLGCTMLNHLDAAALGSPLFLVKARIQAYSPAFPVGAQHHYKNSRDALRSIYREGGLRGLWRGVNAAILRTACVRDFASVSHGA